MRPIISRNVIPLHGVILLVGPLGIRTGQNRISAASKRYRHICEVSDEEFSGDGVITNHALTRFVDRNAIIQTARGRLGERYDLVFSNCEHFVSWVVNGKANSPQVRSWVWTIIVGVVLGVTAAAMLCNK